MLAALLVLLLILLLFGAGGIAVHFLWVVLIVALVAWALMWFIGGAAGGPRGYWRRY